MPIQVHLVHEGAPRAMKRPAQRHLHHGHFAFMRAVVQGIDAQDSWDRYMRAEGEHRDARTVRRTIEWIRDAFAVAARQAKRPGLARLILLEPALVKDVSAPPSLEDFAVLHGLEDFSEDEQIEAYQAAMASASSQSSSGRRGGRRQRLVAKQLEALRWLEQHVVQAPTAADPLSSWLDESIARRMARAGLKDVGQLVEHVNAHGDRWWLHVPGVGVRKSVRVLEWLKLHAKEIKMDVGAHVFLQRKRVPAHLLEKVVKSGTALRPYEKFEVPPALAGGPRLPEQGEGECLLTARSDREAVDAWLDAATGGADGAPRSASTSRSYRKEAERLLLWTVLVRRKAISSLHEDDVQAYRDFLGAPPADWCGPRHAQRWSPRWRPFEGPLAPAAIVQAMTVLHGLFAFWVRHAYLKINPFAAQTVRRFRPSAPKAVRSGSISPSDWALLEALLEDEMATAHGRRLARAMRWLRFSELGLARLTHLRCEHLHRKLQSHGDDEWSLVLDDVPRKVLGMPVPAALVEEVQAELRRQGRPGDVTDPNNRGVHILARFRCQDQLPPPWSASGLTKAIRATFERAAARADSEGAQRWARASVRSLRAERGRQSLARQQSVEPAAR
ncbi:phage integrase family protein [Variovorax sp. 770b2]|uniref:phage integrase family protein n=1 Tax=Variovorax sp. 770b2 TaxID=1566271 RepID=UPI0015A5C7AD|nr:phage integrase family protein [Variovorax sp. 770b2]